ncbi:Nucleotide-diphospho-sugar transferase protein [Actinidia chinensis var. chinensis]|uniref:Nucleotide-diphospho-sugar transferase protein n=1 Tax=Actinidia chinensis var. chinensis TaxID=1590841 RepID=A0A2R6RR18_ACTCC|nr:Nucleotide-diphospho-sugar transferase protein [Actinidia chinensis var. chinensis]
MKSSTIMVNTLSTIKSFSLLMKNRAVDFTIFTLLLVGFLYIFLISTSSKDMPFFPSPKSPHHSKHPSMMFGENLDTVLAETSTADKTVIIAVVNRAYVDGDVSMLDLFLDGFWLGDGTRSLKDHLLIVAVDQTSHERCRFLRLHCYRLETDGVDFDGEKLYMSDEFIEMMWRRTLFLVDVLKRGYNFIFTDIDVIWLRNPFSRLIMNASIDFQISTDKFNGNEQSEANPINTGFYMIRSNKKTVGLFNAWYARKNNSKGMKEQDVLERLMREGKFRDLGLRVKFLDTLYFSGFCQNSRDVRAVVTVHANCCRSISAKVADLTAVIHDWKRFKRSSANETMTFGWSKHVACINSWKN